MEVYFHGNTHRAQIKGLKDDNGAEVNNASVTLTLKNAAGTTLAGPLTLTAEGSGGDYEGTVSSGLSVTPGEIIVAEVEVLASGDRGFWKVPIQIQTRT